MATMLLHLLSVFSLLLATASARPGLHFHPCNTVIISTFTFSLNQPQNPNHPANPNPVHGEFIFMDLRPRLPRFHHPRLFLHRFSGHNLLPAPGRIEFVPKPQRIELDRADMTDLPLLGLSSFRDRTKDILSVVASLLFGAACGALTAGTMYLIWSLLTYRQGYYRSLDGFTSDGDDDDNDDDLFNPKKPQDYVPIPASPVKEKVKDADHAAVAVAKETV